MSLDRQLRILAVAAMLVVASSPCAATNPAVYDVGADPDVGFNLISWYNDPVESNEVASWESAVQSIYNAGFREVSIASVRFVDITTGNILATSPKGPDLSSIGAGVAKAKQLGMRVTLNPFIELYDPTETANEQYFADITWGTGPASNRNTWRGAYNPNSYPNAATQTPEFWHDYKDYMVEVAQLAESRGADSMNVGTEYNAINLDSSHNANWTDVIDAVDKTFHGRLGYAANWDMYNNANVSASIWNNPAIDYMGIDAYFTNSVTNAQADASGAFPNPTFIGQMEAAWDNRLDNAILPYAAGRKGGEGMPVELTEVGYLPFNRTGRNPQNESGQAVDTAEQRMAFNGLINAADGRKEFLNSIHIWQWAMVGSGGSKWNISANYPADQPNNVDLGMYLSSYVNTATRVYSADFNFNGAADGIDFLKWQQNFEGPAANANFGDANGDGVTNGDDFVLWIQQFGQGYPSTVNGGSVPEPASAALIALALAAWRAAPRSFGRRSSC